MALERLESKGHMTAVATTGVTLRYLKGLVPKTSKASICSVTRIDPSSAPIPEPILPAQISAVTTGEISHARDTDTISSNIDCAQISTNVGLDCIVSTNRMINAVTPTNGKVLCPTKKHWYRN